MSRRILRILACTALITGVGVVVARADAGKPAQVQLLAKPGWAVAKYFDNVWSAQSSVDMEYWTMPHCHTVNRLLYNELFKKVEQAKAQGREFKVRVLVDRYALDAWAKGTPLPELAQYLKARGVELKLYNQSWEWRPKYNYRNHRKQMVFDGKSVILGGRNMADEYFGMANWANFVDKDIAVTGEAAREAQNSFEDFWNDPVSAQPNPEWLTDEKGKPLSYDQAQAKMAARKAEVENCLKPKPGDEELLKKIREQLKQMREKDRVFNCPNVRFVGDRPYSASDNKVMGDEIKKFVSTAQSSLDIENYTFLPDGPLQSAFDEILKKGKVKTTVVTNGGGDGDPAKVQQELSYLAHNEIYRATGAGGNVSAYAYSQKPHPDDLWFGASEKVPWLVHSKVLVKDDDSVVVSSYNLDPRSRHTNAELAAVVENCPDFAKHVKESIHENAVLARDMRPGSDYHKCYEQEQAKISTLTRWWRQIQAEAIKDYL